MEFLNRVELTGIVGNVEINPVPNGWMVSFSLQTCYTHKDAEGNAFVETTWHRITAYGDDFKGLKHGVWVNIKGRIRQRKYTVVGGGENVLTDIVAYNWKIVDDLKN